MPDLSSSPAYSNTSHGYKSEVFWVWAPELLSPCNLQSRQIWILFPRDHSEDPGCTYVLHTQCAGTICHHLPIHPHNPFLLVRRMKVYQDRSQTCKQSSLIALTYLQLSPAVQFVRRLGLSLLRDIKMQGRGAALTDVPLQKTALVNYFLTRAIIQLLNHRFA